jgi:hypothetical protein
MTPEITYQINSGVVRMIVGRIDNRRASGRSGSLTLELWAHREAITGGTVSFFALGRLDLGSMPAGSAYNNVDVRVPYLGDPSNGCFFVSMVIVENGSSYRDWATFSECVVGGNDRTGACCGSPTLTPTPVPSRTPLPGNDPGTVLGTLDEGFWAQGSATGVFDAPAFEDNEEGFALWIQGAPTSTFGYWQTRQTMDPLPAGTYRLSVRLRAVGDREPNQSPPELRVRVFPENALRQQFATAATSGGEPLPSEVFVYFENDGATRWRVAVDLLGFRPDYAGGVQITSMQVQRVK